MNMNEVLEMTTRETEPGYDVDNITALAKDIERGSRHFWRNRNTRDPEQSFRWNHMNDNAARD